MKAIIITCIAAVGCAVFGVILSDVGTAGIEEYSSNRRPFSWYYPYNYKYYYPRPHYEGGPPTGSGGYWIYSNGTYMYRSY
jgi:hypothetical protein